MVHSTVWGDYPNGFIMTKAYTCHKHVVNILFKKKENKENEPITKCCCQ